MKIINLLPKPKQDELHNEAVFHSVAVAVMIGLITLVLVAVLQAGLGVYLQREQVAISQEIELLRAQSSKEENADLKTQITSINNQLKDYQDLSNASPLWSKALRAFVANVPEGIKITRFSADTAKKQINISGYSPTRELVIELYNQLSEDQEHFRDVNYPLENVAKPTDIEFHFSFFVQDKLINPNGGTLPAPVTPKGPSARTIEE